MLRMCSRRSLLKFVSAMLPLKAINASAGTFSFERENNENSWHPIADSFPSHPPELVREMVTVAHFNLSRVKELVDARPSLARAAWDWGFGDWETALGAASHMGNRAIAEYLIANGARPSLFSAAMFGQLEVIKAFIAAHPHLQRTRGPHGISLLAHARAGGAVAHPVVDFLQSLGDADADPTIPLGDDEITALSGTYPFGLGVNQRIDVTADRTLSKAWSYMYSPLTWTRKGTMGRPLVHLGGHVFYPAGAPSVRIRFSEGKDGAFMTVDDSGLTLSARKDSAAQS